MKYLTLFIVSAILFVGLSFAGKSFFGMDHGMTMGSVECVNHCIDVSTFPSVMSSSVPVLFFIAIAFFCNRYRQTLMHVVHVVAIKQQRHTEPIRLFLLSQNLSTVILRD